MVGIPMDRVGAGMLECGWYCTANGIAFRVGCNRVGCSGTLVLLSSRLIVGMVVGYPYRYIILRDGGIVLFASVVSAHCTDGVSFARILLLSAM